MRREIQRLIVWALLAGGTLLEPGSALADDAALRHVRDGVAIYFGIVAAEMIRGHPPGHPESEMHGGIPTDGSHHIMIALFDDNTGRRITNAQARARLVGATHVGGWRQLEIMTVRDQVTYGNYIKMPDSGMYSIEVEVHVPGHESPLRTTFTWGRT